MCKWCDGGDDCCIWMDGLTGDYYLDVVTGEWDDYDDGFVHQREYVSYCPYCGRKLKKEEPRERIYHISYVCDGCNYGYSIYRTKKNIRTIEGYNAITQEICKINGFKSLVVLNWTYMEE